MDMITTQHDFLLQTLRMPVPPHYLVHADGVKKFTPLDIKKRKKEYTLAYLQTIGLYAMNKIKPSQTN